MYPLQGSFVTATIIKGIKSFVFLNQEFGQRVNYCVYICHSDSYLTWMGVLFGYKALFQIIAILLAFGTRKVKVQGLDDAKYIAGIIYATSIVLSVIIVSFVTLADYLNALAALYSIGYLTAASVITGLVFIPRVTQCYTSYPNQCVYSPLSVIL